MFIDSTFSFFVALLRSAKWNRKAINIRPHPGPKAECEAKDRNTKIKVQSTKDKVQSTKTKAQRPPQKTKMSELTGTSIIGFERGKQNGDRFRGVDAASGVALAPDYHAASEVEVDQAVNLAHRAFQSFGDSSPAERARLLNTIAGNIESLTDGLVDRAIQETGLPEARIRT